MYTEAVQDALTTAEITILSEISDENISEEDTISAAEAVVSELKEEAVITAVPEPVFVSTDSGTSFITFQGKIEREKNENTDEFISSDESVIISSIVEESTSVQQWEYMHLIVNHTYLYPEPSTDHIPAESRSVYINDTIEVREISNGYYYARTNDGSGGYMYGYVLTECLEYGIGEQIDSYYSFSSITVIAESANIRSTPDKNINDNIITIVYKGETFNVISFDEYWFEIDYNGESAYISYKMIKQA